MFIGTDLQVESRPSPVVEYSREARTMVPSPAHGAGHPHATESKVFPHKLGSFKTPFNHPRTPPRFAHIASHCYTLDWPQRSFLCAPNLKSHDIFHTHLHHQ